MGRSIKVADHSDQVGCFLPDLAVGGAVQGEQREALLALLDDRLDGVENAIRGLHQEFDGCRSTYKACGLHDLERRPGRSTGRDEEAGPPCYRGDRDEDQRGADHTSMI